MRSKLLAGGLTVAAAALLVTNPVVVNAAGMITGADIKDGTVTTADVKDGSLLKKDLKAGVLPVGAPGYEVVTSEAFDNPNGQQTSGVATCPEGKVPTGGGVVAMSGVGHDINSSAPSGNGWLVYVNNTTGVDSHFFVYVVCMTAPPAPALARVLPPSDPKSGR